MGKFFKTRWRWFSWRFNLRLSHSFRFKETLMTEEQIRARHDFFLRRYNISADPVVWNHEACLHVQRLWISQVILLNSGVMISDNNATRMKSPHKRYTSRLRDKRIVQENIIHTLFRTHELRHSRWFKLSWNQVVLKSRLTWICAQNCFSEIKVDFKVDLRSR